MGKTTLNEASFGGDLIAGIKAGLASYAGRKSTRFIKNLPEGMRRASSEPGLRNTKLTSIQQSMTLETCINSIPPDASQAIQFMLAYSALLEAVETIQEVKAYETRLLDELNPMLEAANAFAADNPQYARYMDFLKESSQFRTPEFIKAFVEHMESVSTDTGFDVFKDLADAKSHCTPSADGYSKDTIRDCGKYTLNGKPLLEGFENVDKSEKGWPGTLEKINEKLIAQGQSQEAKKLIADSLPLLHQNGFLGRAYAPSLEMLTLNTGGVFAFQAPTRSLDLSLDKDPITVTEHYQVQTILVHSHDALMTKQELKNPITLEHTFTITRGPDGNPKATTQSLNWTSPNAPKVAADVNATAGSSSLRK